MYLDIRILYLSYRFILGYQDTVFNATGIYLDIRILYSMLQVYTWILGYCIQCYRYILGYQDTVFKLQVYTLGYKDFVFNTTGIYVLGF